MSNTIGIYLIPAIIITILLCRINANQHKKNYSNFLDELKLVDSDNKEGINLLMKYISKQSEIQEMNQYIYIAIILIYLTVLIYNL